MRLVYYSYSGNDDDNLPEIELSLSVIVTTSSSMDTSLVPMTTNSDSTFSLSEISYKRVIDAKNYLYDSPLNLP